MFEQIPLILLFAATLFLGLMPPAHAQVPNVQTQVPGDQMGGLNDPDGKPLFPKATI
jgi:hypothetical protein